MNNRPTYHEVGPITRTEALRELASDDPLRIARALVSVALHEPELGWAQQQCEKYASHPAADVRGVVATCLGHLARIHRRLDLTTATPLLQQLAQDPDVAGRVEDALDDIRLFLKPR